MRGRRHESWIAFGATASRVSALVDACGLTAPSQQPDRVLNGATWFSGVIFHGSDPSPDMR